MDPPVVGREQLAAAERALGGSGGVAYGPWAQAFLATVPAAGCRSNLVAVLAWEAAEHTAAAWNPLATTY